MLLLLMTSMQYRERYIIQHAIRSGILENAKLFAFYSTPVSVEVIFFSNTASELFDLLLLSENSLKDDR